MERTTCSTSAVLKIGITAMLALLLIGACACSPSEDGAADGPGGAATQSADAQPGSMLAVHTPDQIKLIDGDYSKKNCLSCHPRDTITAATADYAGQKGFNPHAAHTESYDCTKCHSIDGPSVLVCNTACHGGYHGDGVGWQLPETGWQDPTDDLPSADGEPL